MYAVASSDRESFGSSLARASLGAQNEVQMRSRIRPPDVAVAVPSSVGVVVVVPGNHRNESAIRGMSPLARQRLTQQEEPPEEAIQPAAAVGTHSGEVSFSAQPVYQEEVTDRNISDSPLADVGPAADGRGMPRAGFNSLPQSNVGGGLNILAEFSAQRSALPSTGFAPLRATEPHFRNPSPGVASGNIVAHSTNFPSSAQDRNMLSNTPTSTDRHNSDQTTPKFASQFPPAAGTTTGAQSGPPSPLRAGFFRRPVRQVNMDASVAPASATLFATGETEATVPSQGQLAPFSPATSTTSTFAASQPTHISSGTTTRLIHSRPPPSRPPRAHFLLQPPGDNLAPSASPLFLRLAGPSAARPLPQRGGHNDSVGVAASAHSHDRVKTENDASDSPLSPLSDNEDATEGQHKSDKNKNHSGRVINATSTVSAFSSQVPAAPDSESDSKTSPPAKCAADPEQKHSCCICLEEPEKYDLASINGCDHLFCFSCIEKWADRENTCPLCKVRFENIERVNKKRRRIGDTAQTPGSNMKDQKRVKNKDQRSDVTNTTLRQMIAAVDVHLSPLAQIILGNAVLSREGEQISAPQASQTLRRTRHIVAFDSTNVTVARESSSQSAMSELAAALRSGRSEPSAALRRFASSPSRASPTSNRPIDGFYGPSETFDGRAHSAAAAFASGEVSRGNFVFGGEGAVPRNSGFGSFQTRTRPRDSPVDLNLDFGDDSENEDYGSFVQEIHQTYGAAQQTAMDRYFVRTRAFDAATASSIGTIPPSVSQRAGRTPDTALEIDDSDGDDDGVEIVRVTGSNGRL